MNKRVLLADNDLDFLEGRAEMLAGAGYEVLKAASREQAESILNNYWLHAAIIDVRLQDDNDSKDVTGLALAKMKVFQKIPKIILTRWPNYQAVREALSHHLDDLPPAVDFLDKREGPKAMIEALERVFQHQLRINWNLVIQTNQRHPLAPAQIVNLIEPGASGEGLLQYADEFEDLFRRLFHGEERIKIDRLLWHREGRVALSVFVFAKDKAPAAELVVCGGSAAIEDEARRWADHAPKVQGSGNTWFDRCVSTTHFGANAYTLSGYDLENPIFLSDVVNNGSERDLTTSIQFLFESSLKEWQQQKRIVDSSMTTADWYQARANGNKALVKQPQFEAALKVIAEQTMALGLKIKCTPEKLTFDFGLRQIEHSNPTPAIYDSAYSDDPAVLLNTPGKLSAENLLVDNSNRVWITDFGDTGFAPPAWNFVEVEAAARFDWLETTDLDWLYQMETVLLADDFSRLNINDVEPPLRRFVKSIKVVRRYAIKFLRQNFRSYQLGILYQAAARIADFDPAFQLMPGQLARLTHCLMAAAMIADHISVVETKFRGNQGKMKGIHLNRSHQVAYVDGVPISIKGRGFRLLLGFYENAGRLCTRRQIIEQFLAERYDEKDQSQVSRLNTAIFRLRERIEEDPYHPRFLITEPGGGYRFLTHPEDH